MLFELEVDREEEVSIRFNQFYHGYLKPEHRENYEYSPALIELYHIEETEGKRRYKLKDYCQGCSRGLVGARSIRTFHVIENVQGT